MSVSTAAATTTRGASLGPRSAQRGLLRFSVLLIAAAVFLQRFGLPFGARQIDIVGPLGLCLVGFAFLRGYLVLHRGRLLAFALLAAWVLLGTAIHMAVPDPFGAYPDLKSIAQFLLLTAFAVFGFREPLDETLLFRGVNDVLAIVAIAGILQFALQFVGLSLFAFHGILPEPLLYEQGYMQIIGVGVGDLLKSNGFFLEEPSLFSQFMAVALMLEALGSRRKWHFALFAAGLLLSFSGTGWIVLAVFLATIGVRLGRSGIVIALGVGAGLAFAVIAMLLLAPDLASAIADRFAEFSTPGTSGYLRFSTPFQMAGSVLHRDPAALLTGIGAGASERLNLPYEYDVNTPIKIVLEYGLPALVAYLSLFLVGQHTAKQGALLAPLIVLVLVTGGYQEFPPVLFPVLLLTSLAWLDAGQRLS